MGLGGWLKEQRGRRGWSLRKAGEKFGITHSYLSALENERRVPSAEVLGRIAKAFDLSPEEVERLGGQVPPELRHWLERTPGAQELVTTLIDLGLPMAVALDRLHGTGTTEPQNMPVRAEDSDLVTRLQEGSRAERDQAAFTLAARVLGSRAVDETVLGVWLERVRRVAADGTTGAEIGDALLVDFFHLSAPPNGAASDTPAETLGQYFSDALERPPSSEEVQFLVSTVLGPEGQHVERLTPAIWRDLLEPVRLEGLRDGLREAVDQRVLEAIASVDGGPLRFLCLLEAGWEALWQRLATQGRRVHHWIDPTWEVRWAPIEARADAPNVRGARPPSPDDGHLVGYTLTPYPTLGARVGDTWEAVLAYDGDLWFHRTDQVPGLWRPVALMHGQAAWARPRGLRQRK